jgi:RNA polymerase sigma-70 factor, ECF subfamily
VPREVLDRAAAGDRDAVRLVVEASHDLVRGMLVRMMGRGPDVDDCVQTALMRIATGLPGLRAAEAFSTWAGGICVNAARDHFRRRRVREIVVNVAESDALQSPDAEDGEQRLAARQLLRRCEGLLDQLSPQHRTVFVLRVLFGHSVDEIAAMTRAAKSTTRLRLYYARKKFAKLAAAFLDAATEEAP